ncbi:hypothetical protein J3R30DRAFT_2387358 [Lentinula aciculospora]|uniref:BTB domain-containing protein n=1 Tax=Lentinula aciculospora TaxID=153920 RepID=A0A9W9AFS7_9AGAR|nr:hypothetical protein J3R30DRAFT_2387358 [Lentinula aciculospora]
MASAPATVIISDVPDHSKAGLRLNFSHNHQYHPLFSSPAADVVLCASDGVMYRMHSYTLRTTSGFFRDMFTLPQPNPPPRLGLFSENNEKRGDIFVSTYVSSGILTLFLMLTCGMPINTPLHEWGIFSVSDSSPDTGCIETSLHSCFDTIDRVLRLAENWDAPGPLSYLRLGLRNPELVKQDPLKLFSIASHFGWEYERKWAAQHSLMIDISPLLDTHIQKNLEDMSSKDLLCLLKLRHRRKEEFRAFIDDPEHFSVGNSENILCMRCHEARIDNGTWKVLKEAMVMELERRPLGDSIVGSEVGGIGGEHLAEGIVTWPEAEACFNASCEKKGCKSPNYDACATLKQIQGCVDSLPWEL